jgi:hypothetical protein
MDYYECRENHCNLGLFLNVMKLWEFGITSLSTLVVNKHPRKYSIQNYKHKKKYLRICMEVTFKQISSR